MNEKDKKRKIEVQGPQPEALPEPSDAADGEVSEPNGGSDQAAAPEDSTGPTAQGGEPTSDQQTRDEELQRLRAEVEEYKDKYLRALAELENFRRRVQEERVRQMQYANERLLRELLPIVDDLERALEAQTDSVDALRKGVEMILSKLRQTLEAFGVEALETVGEAFDPYLHEAVDRVVTSEVPEGTIVSELQRGYKYHERLLRPARVTVAVAPQPEDGDAEKSKGNG